MWAEGVVCLPTPRPVRDRTGSLTIPRPFTSLVGANTRPVFSPYLYDLYDTGEDEKYDKYDKIGCQKPQFLPLSPTGRHGYV